MTAVAATIRYLSRRSSATTLDALLREAIARANAALLASLRVSR